MRLARSGGRSARGVGEVDAIAGGWVEDEGGSSSVLPDMIGCQQTLYDKGHWTEITKSMNGN